MRFRVVGKNVLLFFFRRRLPWFLQLVTNRSHFRFTRDRRIASKIEPRGHVEE